MSSEKREILHQLRSLLYYHQLTDLGGYPRSSELDAFLNSEYLSEKFKRATVEKRLGETVTDSSPKSSPILPNDAIEEIAEEVRVCRSCDLCQDRVASVPGSGGYQVRLLIVGGWLTASNQEGIDNSCVFGTDEDQMLLRMLNAIHFPEKETFVTNVIKCGITQSVQPKKENVEICVSYLYRQISAILPDVICSMGLIATRALLQSSKPLSQLRGRFHDYRKGDGKTIAIMPTYHPSFLLKNPEMKAATWSDLQLIEKKLNG